MKIVAFVGASESGKTRLVSRLVPLLAARGLSVGVLKHCGHGFDLGGEDKDSSKFLAAGAEAVALAGPGRTALLRREIKGPRLEDLVRRDLGACHIVLVEGGKSEPGVMKVEVLRAGVPAELRTPPAELLAVVADHPVAAAVPVFDPEAVEEIAAWIAKGVIPPPASPKAGEVP